MTGTFLGWAQAAQNVHLEAVGMDNVGVEFRQRAAELGRVTQGGRPGFESRPERSQGAGAGVAQASQRAGKRRDDHLRTGRFGLLGQWTVLAQQHRKLPTGLGRAHAQQHVHEAHFSTAHTAARIQIDHSHAKQAVSPPGENPRRALEKPLW